MFIFNLRVSCRFDEIKTCMYTHIHNTFTTGLLFLSHVVFMLIVNKVNDRNPAMTVIHIITKTRSINNGQLDLKHLFLQFSSGDLDLSSFGRDLCTSLIQVFGLLDGGCEECIDKCCLATTRFAFIYLFNTHVIIE